MVWSLVKNSIFGLGIRSSSSLICLAPIYIQTDKIPFHGKEIFIYNCSKVFISDKLYRKPLNFQLRYLCNSVTPRRLCWEGSSHDILLRNIEIYIRNHLVDEAWEAYTNFKKLYGLPDDHLLSRFITELSYAREPKWLQRACDIIFLLPNKKSNSLHFDQLYNLSLSLARAQMPIPASMILRMMIEKDNIPPTNLLGPLMLHMVKKEIGTYLASNILIQICDLLQHSGSNWCTRKKPDTTIFNLVLDSCSRYNLSFKAQQIIELMSLMGLVGDAYTIITIARIHAVNGQRDELKKFKICVDQVAGYLGHLYFHFYDSLMSLHFKFNDIDSVSKLIFDMISLSGAQKGPQKAFLIPLGSPNLKKGLKLQVLPHFLHENSLAQMERNEGFVTRKNKRLVFTNKTLAKLIVGYKRANRISELSKVLCRIQENGRDEMNIYGLSADVIDACIHMGWLETAHDILDDMEQAGNLPNTDSYASLLTAYRESNKHREVESLLKQIKKMGTTLSDETRKATVSSKRSDLVKCLIQEMKKGDINCSVYEFNSSIYFFMKAEMIDDALKTYKSMQRMNIHPNVATYMYMMMGYSSLKMYRDITILWGDIKRSFDAGNLLMNIDLYEVLILNFFKGGYFERMMEVIVCMKKDEIYADKWLYKNEFLKLHKDLYRKLKFPIGRTEAQSRRVEHVKAFRKWAGID